MPPRRQSLSKAKKAQLAQRQAKAAKQARTVAWHGRNASDVAPVLLVDLDSLQVGWDLAPALLEQAMRLAGPGAVCFAAGNPSLMTPAVHAICAALGMHVLEVANVKNAARSRTRTARGAWSPSAVPDASAGRVTVRGAAEDTTTAASW